MTTETAMGAPENEVEPKNAPPVATPEEIKSAKITALVVYGLFGFGVVTGIATLIGLIVAYLKRKDMRNTVYGGHMDMLIKTFWINLALGIAGFALLAFYVGFVILIATLIWYLYRIVRGFICAVEGKPIWY